MSREDKVDPLFNRVVLSLQERNGHLSGKHLKTLSQFVDLSNPDILD